MESSKRTFRTQASLDAEAVSRDAVAPFLKSRGFAVESDIRTRTGTAESQVVTATTPNGNQIKMRVRLCWRWDGRQNNCSAAQLRARLIDNDWDQTLEAIVSRDKSEGISHSLLLQRSNANIVYAALIPITKLHAIWKKQSAVSAKLIADGKMGRVKKNHAKNGESPTVWLMDKRTPEAHLVSDVLWNWPGVIDLVNLPVVLSTSASKSEQKQAMISKITGTIHGLGKGKRYADGIEPMEILVPKSRANGLPYSYDNLTSIDLQINGEHYHAGIRATKANRNIYISQGVKTKDGISEKLAYVLTSAGFKINDKVILEIDDHNIVLKAASSSHFPVYPPEFEQGFTEDAKQYYSRLDTEVSRSRSDSEARKARIKAAPRMPASFSATTTIFRRNPDVIAETLERANGYCEKCRKKAPFKRASDGSPYLEVHHHIPLAEGGEDTIENTLSLCPNCHREAHFGQSLI